MFSDLECDFVNPIDLCAKLNPVSLMCDLNPILFLFQYQILVCFTWICFTLDFDGFNVGKLSILSISPESPPFLVPRPSNPWIPPLVRSNWNIPKITGTQARIFHQIDFLFDLFLLLPLSNDFGFNWLKFVICV